MLLLELLVVFFISFSFSNLSYFSSDVFVDSLFKVVPLDMFNLSLRSSLDDVLFWLFELILVFESLSLSRSSTSSTSCFSLESLMPSFSRLPIESLSFLY